MKHITAKDVLDYFQGWGFPENLNNYVMFHKDRYAFLINFIDETLQKLNVDASMEQDFSILDVGVGPQTALLKHFFTENIYTLDTLERERSFFSDQRFNGREHFVFNLHDSLDPASHKEFGVFSAIVMSEVLEHVIASPKVVFSYLAKLMKDEGLLFVQTPNGAGLKSRLSLMIGKNPFALPPESSEFYEYGHIREYTFKELISLGKAAGLTATVVKGHNYFRVSKSRMIDAYNFICNRFLPRTLRSGITICFQKKTA